MNKNNQFEPVFSSDKDWKFNACFNFTGDKLYPIIEGYKEAGDRLVESLKENRYSVDYLVYPILYLYRHYIELSLKDVIESGASLLNKDISYPKKHKLEILWDHAKPIIREVFKGQKENGIFDKPEHVVKEFSMIDPESTTFRYHIYKNGDATELIAKDYINLRKVSDNLNDYSNFIDGVRLAISAYLDYKREFENYANI